MSLIYVNLNIHVIENNSKFFLLGNNDAVHSFLDTDHLDNSLKYEVDHEDLLERFISGGIENSGSEFDRYNQNDDVNYGNDYNDQHHHEHRKDYDHHHYTDNVLKDHDHQINHDHQYHHEHQDQTDHGHHHKHQDHHDHHYKHHHEDHDNYNHPNGNDDDFYNYKDLSHHLYAYYDHHY